jgi:sugar phosphate isomerase/epimerase
VKTSFVVSIAETNLRTGGCFGRIIPYLYSIGYDGVELAVREPAKVPLELLKETLESNQLEVPAIATGQVYLSENIFLSNIDIEIRQRAIDRLEEYMHLAHLLGADVIIGLIRGGVMEGNKLDKGIHLFTESLRYLCERAEHNNVGLLIEPINRYETSLIPTLQSAAELINKIGSDRLKILMDTFHMNIEEASISESIEKYGSMIGHVHFADSNRLAPGRGHIDFREVLNSLDRVNYKGFISFEILPQPSLEKAAEDAFNFISEIINVL